ncbi:SRPBCC family protein [Phenylobacterium montanum]|uniref:SRPBCC family protein n=1 Tax=Phenylobacterium montanum TaxID=2823693 RepID=A0A975IU13_9CAUL|nr:SRPBCC family protein [Caulobacter sp. S6]QUD87285.1 SRPBCC family protein [Caulobacter sp. S6]
MATIIRTIDLDAPADAAWRLLEAPGEAARAFPGVLTDSHIDGDVRTVTFAGGLVARERIVTLDPEAGRIAYSVIEGRFSHHSAAMQVEAAGEGKCRLVWTSDFLPQEATAMVGPLMDQGLAAFKAVAEGRA